jgi:hypothetical protein
MRLVLVCCIAVLLSSCVISKTVSLTSNAVMVTKSKEPVESMTVVAPSVGTEILVFADYVKGGLYGSSGLIFSNYKRADFTYTLTNDVRPELEKVIGYVYPISQDSAKKIKVNIDFKYYIPSTGLVRNTIGIAMTAKVELLSLDKVEKTDNFVIEEIEGYSTFPVTYPREESFHSLFQKALAKLAQEMSEK